MYYDIVLNICVIGLEILEKTFWFVCLALESGTGWTESPMMMMMMMMQL